jgi:hypothetical protein
MPRMNILNTVEREAFESPPVFNSVQRTRAFPVLNKLPPPPKFPSCR